MKYSIKKEANPAELKADCIIVPVFAESELSGSASTLDEHTSGALTALLELGDFSGKKESVEVVYNLAGVKAKRILLAGCGDKEKFEFESLRSVMQAVAKQLKTMKLGKAVSFMTETMPQSDQSKAVQQIITAISGCFYQLDDYKSDKKEQDTPSLQEFVLAGIDDEQACMQAVALAEGVTFARNLANQPGNVCTPAYLAEHAAQLAEEVENLSLEVLEEPDMEALGMGAFISVSKGSAQDGKLIILNYSGGQSDGKPAVLVGKGITFDTGGISLKPGAKMDEMKFDMGGAASVLGTMRAITAMQLPMNVIGVIAAAENMPSGHASKPGDIVTSMSGKTIEILNTDAEGRLVLCDALTYVKKYDPDVVIDIATLTGACIVALGHHICGLISNDDGLANDLMSAGEDVLDQAWRLPYNEKYTKQLESEFADLGNIGGPAAGTITAGCFLAQFTEDYTWAHLDVAGTAWSGKASTGRPVPLLTQYLINRQKQA